MQTFLFQILLPMTLTGGLFTALWFLLRPFKRFMSGRTQTLAVFIAAILFILPLGLLLRSDENQPAAQAPSQTQQIQPWQQSVRDAMRESPVVAPAYNAGKYIGDFAQENPTQSETPNQTTPVDWITVCAWIYVCGVGMSAIVTAVQYGLFVRRLKNNTQPVSVEWQLAVVRQLCDEMRIKNMPRTIVSGIAATPFITGIVKTTMVVPKQHMPEAQFTYAVRHELTHYKHKDLLIKMCLVCVSALHWMNPLAHVLRNEYANACEMRCDEAVMRALTESDRKPYATALLQFAAVRLPYAASGFATPKTKLKTRLVRIMKPLKLKKLSAGICAAALAVLLTAGLLTGCGLSAGLFQRNASDNETHEPFDYREVPQEMSSSFEFIIPTRSQILLYEGKTKEVFSYTELLDALSTGYQTVVLKKDVNAWGDFLCIETGITLVIESGVTLDITMPNFTVLGRIINDGHIIVSDWGRILFYQESKKIGDIQAIDVGRIVFAGGALSADEIAYYLSPTSIYNDLNLVPDVSTITIDRDLIIPAGKGLWLNIYCTLYVPEGVTLTINGTLETHTQPQIEGTVIGSILVLQ